MVALIRGINVGTSKRVAMAALRDMLSGLGYQDVRTLLNSGNAVFRTTAAPDAVAEAVEDGLEQKIGVPAKVVIRTRAQILAAMAQDPFASIATDGSKHFLGFFAETPKPAVIEQIPELNGETDTAPDLAKVIGDHLYLWCPNGLSGATFVKVNWDRKLGTAVTVRNWNTVTKLVELMSD